MNKMNNQRRLSVEVNNGNIEDALKRLKRKLKRDNFYVEMKKREYYMKPSVEKKMKKRRKKLSSGEEL